MRRVTTLIIAVVVGLAALAFMAQNREIVALGFWPLPERWEMPLFVAVLIAIVVGFFAGGLVSWLAAGRWRRMARRYVAESERLQRRVDELESALATEREAVRRDMSAAPAAPSALRQPDRPLRQIAGSGGR